MYKSEDKRKYYGSSSYSRNYQYPWSIFEDELVLDDTRSDAEIARELGRSVASIQKRRWFLKKLYTEGESPWN